MRFETYDHKVVELQVLDYWKKNTVVQKLRKKYQKGKPFYFLQGPPYTSGRVHIGTAFQTSLKDVVLRYKRMRGFNVWDRMGYDMHGLPTEQKVMTKLNLKNKEEIEQFGVKKFTQECEQFCTDMMYKMNEDFIRLGITLDFSNPYQPIEKEFMEGEWWLIKQAHEKKRLYQGLRTMHWDAATQTAVAKHELEYRQVTDAALYVKFPLVGRKNTFFVIWTTTPWTIPLNLAIMVNPKLTYVEVVVASETWIVAKDLVQTVMAKAAVENYSLMKEYPGKKLEGVKYLHPLETEKFLPKDLIANPRLFTILLSEEYVDASAGTGLVHCAPGCGPEDYEVGHLHHLPPFNCVDEEGYFRNFGPFSGWKSKWDDKKFIEAIHNAGVLLTKEPYVHDYPYGERSHQPVIFRTTKQWFFKVEDLKGKMLEANKLILWEPQAAQNAFNSWLDNLRDNSITKQRYWGTPVPIWQAADGDYIVVGSIAELEKLSGQKVKEMHIPQIDAITIKKDGKVYTRTPDVLDVWIDAGTASWNCLDYPQNKKLFDKFFPADFILEGKDQIRGWFNLLMIASFLAFDKPSFKAVYMNGFVTDVDGTKMSKSLGNIISPDELIEKHGADVLRYYMFQTNAGEDINFSWEECAAKQRNLLILWNLHKLILNTAQDMKVNPFKLPGKRIENVFGPQERYIISRLHSTIQNVTQLLEQYKLDQIIAPLENLFLELSRNYVQSVRDSLATGDDAEKETVIYTLTTVFFECVKMFQVVVPFVSETIYLNFKDAFDLKEESINNYSWPVAEVKKVNVELEQQMTIAGALMQAGLSAREKAKLGLRWPVKEILVSTQNQAVVRAVDVLNDVLRSQTNAKIVKVVDQVPGVTFKVKANYGKIGPMYGDLLPHIATKLTVDSPETILRHVQESNYYGFTIKGKEVRITREMITVEQEIPPQYTAQDSGYGYVYVNLERTPELEAEGYVRELMRNVQQARKDAGFQKQDDIRLAVRVGKELK
ncbi:TPA: isoleucine--tRNA ligase, partial [Candidatus Woesearchaeota archaeon]|nr:isoleucine--tRNA ligase [Candidatus Woesearchaeota archaeon]